MADPESVTKYTYHMATSASFGDTTVGKTAKVAGYVAVSAVLGYIVSLIADDPAVFGIATPVINVLLVAFKNAVDPRVSNLPTSIE